MKRETKLDPYVRGYCEEVSKRDDDRKPKRGRPTSRELPLLAIVFDTETLADDPSQRLTFGSYAVLARSADGTSYDPNPIEANFFYADSESVPRDFSVRLTRCARDAGHVVPVGVISQHEFLERFHELAVEDGALVCGFNLPFDLTRVARDASEARKSAKGGFSLILWANDAKVPNRRGEVPKGAYKRPRLIIKSLGPRKSSIRFSRTAHFVDAEEKLAYAMKAVRRADRFGPPRWMRETHDATSVTQRKPLYKKWARILHDTPKAQRETMCAKLVADLSADRFARTNTGRFLDVSTLVSALTDRSYSLAGACKAFGVKPKGESTGHPGWDITPDYVTYNWNDVQSTCELLDAALRSFGRHPIDLDADTAFSAASIGKAYFRELGITSPLQRWPDFPRDVLGIAASSFYGGSTGVGFRRCVVPVKYVDFLSMYSTVNALLGTDELLRAADYRIVECTEEMNAILSSMRRGDAFDVAMWKRLSFFGEVVLDGSGIFPVRSIFEEGDAPRIGMCHARSEEPRWYAGPDIVASFVLTGRRPRLRHAFRIEPVRDERGTVVPLTSLRSVKLLGSVAVNPATDNIFAKVIEERVRAKKDEALSKAERERLNTGLKCLANATGYGVFAEVNVDDTGEQREMRVHSGGTSFEAMNDAERAGAFSFLPVATQITAGAHLMLALLEREVKRRGGTIAAWDTDSSAIVATERGGFIEVVADDEDHPTRQVRALAWSDVNAIIKRFETLKPYDRTIVRDTVLKMEDVNYDASGELRDVFMYAVSSKRYCMFELVDGEPRFIVDESGKTDGVKESALGAIVGPVFCEAYDAGTGEPLVTTSPEAKKSEWIPRFWDVIVRRAMGLPDKDVAWLGQHVVGNFKLSSAFVWRQFAALNRGRSYDESTKPYGFGITPRFSAHMIGATPPRLYGAKVPRSDMFPPQDAMTPFFDTKTGLRRAPNIDAEESAYVGMPVMTFVEFVVTYSEHPESKVALPSGEPCDLAKCEYAGPLVRRHVVLDERVVIGKESTIFDDEVADVHGIEDADALAVATLSTPTDNVLRIIDVIPTRLAGNHKSKHSKLVRAIREGRAGRNAATIAVEKQLLEAAGKPKAFLLLVRARQRSRSPEARSRGDAAFDETVRVRAAWANTIAALGGVVADERVEHGRRVRDRAFDAVPPRYRSHERGAWQPGASSYPGNLRDIVAALAVAGIETDEKGLLAWCAADAAPSREVCRRRAKADVDAECETEVRTLLRAEGVRVVEPTKTERKLAQRRRRRDARRKRTIRLGRVTPT